MSRPVEDSRWVGFFSIRQSYRVSTRASAEAAARTFSAMSAPRVSFLLTTTRAKRAFVGLALQGLLLWDAQARSCVAAICVAVGSALFLAFWDLDNWMLVGSLLLLALLVSGPLGMTARHALSGACVCAAAESSADKLAPT